MTEAQVTREASQAHPFPFRRDPQVELSPMLGHLRATEPVSRVRLPSGSVAWLVTRYDDVRKVLSDSRFSMAGATSPDSPELMPMVKLYPGLFSLDPPQHTRARALLVHAFRSRDVRQLTSFVERAAGDLVDAMITGNPPADLLTDFCTPLVTAVASELLGITPAEIEEFRKHFVAMISLRGVEPGRISDDARNVHDIVSAIFETKRNTPSDDVISHIVREYDDNRDVPEAHLIGMGTTLIASTANTPSTQISYAIVTILRHPDQWRLLMTRRDLLDSAVEECFRYSAPLEVEHIRIATEDVDVGGVRISAGIRY